MSALFPFEVHTPYRPFFSDQVEAITLTLIDGEIGLYANHSPFTAPVTTGLLRVKEKTGEWRTAFISGGILEVMKHKAVLIIDTAEWPEEINKDRAEASAKQAQEDLENAMMKYEVASAKENIRKSELRLRVAEMAGNSSS
jgi:F-type H+-transporting ATPase subunit epsilon